MHDTDFVRGLLAEVETRKQDYCSAARIKGLLTVVAEVCIIIYTVYAVTAVVTGVESQANNDQHFTVVFQELHDVPLYYILDQMCNTLHCNMPSMLALRYPRMHTYTCMYIFRRITNAIPIHLCLQCVDTLED